MVTKESERWDQSAAWYLSWWYSRSGCTGGSRSDGNGVSVGLVLDLPEMFPGVGDISGQR